MTELLADVRAHGIAQTTAAVFPPEAVATVMRDVRAAASEQRYRPIPETQRVRKSFLLKLEPSHIGLEALAVCAQAVQAMADAYLGPNVLARTDCYVTYPSQGPRKRSQNWHRDLEAIRVFKAFLYVSDVDERCGPLEYVRDSSDGRGDCQLQGYAKDQHRWNDDPARQVCVGPSGTVFLADTGGIHRGGYSTGGSRLHVMWTWLPA